MNRVRNSLLPLVSALGLVGALVFVSGVTAEELLSAMVSFPMASALIYVALTAALVLLSALKWRRVV